jgi:hypothetical protein
MTLRVLLVLACAFWALISLEILPPLFLNGLDAARQKLAHVWSMGKLNFDLPGSCQDSLQLLHEGYTDLIVLLLLTWALLESKRFLDRRLAAMSPIEA